VSKIYCPTYEVWAGPEHEKHEPRRHAIQQERKVQQLQQLQALKLSVLQAQMQAQMQAQNQR
jgi:hypothetical protein